MSRRLVIVAAVAAILGPVCNAAAQSVSLKNNPFSRPSSQRTVEARAETRAEAAGGPFELRATLVSAQQRLANVGGLVLRPGETVDGHTLLRVYEDRAVFLRAGKQVTVYVKPELVDENDQDE